MANHPARTVYGEKWYKIDNIFSPHLLERRYETLALLHPDWAGLRDD